SCWNISCPRLQRSCTWRRDDTAVLLRARRLIACGLKPLNSPSKGASRASEEVVVAHKLYVLPIYWINRQMRFFRFGTQVVNYVYSNEKSRQPDAFCETNRRKEWKVDKPPIYVFRNIGWVL